MTANPLKGETDLKIGDATYTVALGVNEIVKLEDITGAGIIEIAAWFNDPEKVRVGNMRAVLWAALQRHHPGLTLEQAGDLIGVIGLQAGVEKLGAALQASFPEAETAENPQTASPDGTGKPS